jgi:hypothetical protein
LVELITDGENGLLFDPQEEDGLAAALGRACAMDAPRLQRLSKAAFDSAMRYDWPMIGNLWSGLLHRLVARPRVRRINAQPAPGGEPVFWPRSAEPDPPCQAPGRLPDRSGHDSSAGSGFARALAARYRSHISRQADTGST